MKNFSKRLCAGRLVLSLLILVLAMIFSGCQSVQFLLACNQAIMGEDIL